MAQRVSLETGATESVHWHNNGRLHSTQRFLESEQATEVIQWYINGDLYRKIYTKIYPLNEGKQTTNN
jgi:hypothetical protein